MINFEFKFVIVLVFLVITFFTGSLITGMITVLMLGMFLGFEWGLVKGDIAAEDLLTQLVLQGKLDPRGIKHAAVEFYEKK